MLTHKHFVNATFTRVNIYLINYNVHTNIQTQWCVRMCVT